MSSPLNKINPQNSFGLGLLFILVWDGPLSTLKMCGNRIDMKDARPGSNIVMSLKQQNVIGWHMSVSFPFDFRNSSHCCMFSDHLHSLPDDTRLASGIKYFSFLETAYINLLDICKFRSHQIFEIHRSDRTQAAACFLTIYMTFNARRCSSLHARRFFRPWNCKTRLDWNV